MPRRTHLPASGDRRRGSRRGARAWSGDRQPAWRVAHRRRRRARHRAVHHRGHGHRDPTPSMSDTSSHGPSDDAQVAWREFCALLEQAGAVLARDDLGLTDLDRAEGLRYLGRLTQNGLLSFLENPGPRHPRFSSLPSHCGFGLDNPDNVYSSAGIDPSLHYRISGTRGTIAYLSFAAQNQNYAARDRITGGAGHLNDDDLVLDAEGRFEIIASQQEHSGSWLRLAPDSSMILVRQTFADRAVE